MGLLKAPHRTHAEYAAKARQALNFKVLGGFAALKPDASINLANAYATLALYELIAEVNGRAEPEEVPVAPGAPEAPADPTKFTPKPLSGGWH